MIKKRNITSSTGHEHGSEEQFQGAKISSSRSSLGNILKEHDFLVKEFGEEIVESAEQSIDIIAKFLNKKPNIDYKKMKAICQTLEESKSSSYRDFNAWSNNLSGNAYTDLRDYKEFSIKHQEVAKNKYEILQKYFSKDSIVADVFCGKGEKSENQSSVRGAIGIFSLLGINKALFVDLFNQENNTELNKTFDENYGYAYHFKPHQAQNFMAGETKSFTVRNGKREYLRPDFELFSAKLDALDALKAMPDNSLDGIMINNVDSTIVIKEGYENMFRAEAKRVVKDKGLIFGYCTNIRPYGAEFILNDGIGGWKAMENKKTEQEKKLYTKKIEELEESGKNLHKEIEKNSDIPEFVKRILYHDIGHITRIGKLKPHLHTLSEQELKGLIKNGEKREKRIKKVIVEYHGLYSSTIPKLYPIDLQTSLDEIKEDILSDKRYQDYIRDLTFEIAAHKKINFCEGAIYGIFLNLIKNAINAINEQQDIIKKNGQSDEIHISAKNNEIHVHNYGFIPEELQKERELFKLGTTTGKGGKGIGLYSAEQWITKLGGSIDFTSNEKDGTTFIVTLPEKLIIKE